MTFAAPHYLWLLLIFPPGMLVFFWWSARTQRRLMTQFIRARLLPGLIAGVSSTRQKLRAAGLIAAVICLILALARPQWGYDLEEVTQRGLDIVVAIDTSKSMLAADVAPNRLARAKLAALDLMQQAKSDRLGLVAFAGAAFLQCPLTVDDVAFRQSLQALDVNTIPEGGTALAEAIETALKAFKEGDNYKVLVLFTDGEDHDSGALDAARQAAEAGLRIFTVGIGSAEGELLALKDQNGQINYVRDENGNVVKSHLNEKLLQEIAQAAHGIYLPLRADTVDVLYQKELAPLPKSQFQEKWVRRLHERYHWPLALAIVLLIAETLLPERKRQTRKTAAAPAKTAAAPAAVFLLLLLPLAASGSSSSALRDYKSGQYDLSLKEYERLLEKKSDDPRLHFNAGAAAYRRRQFDQAVKHFDRALTAPDAEVNLQEQAYYNLGNSLYQLGDQNPDPTKKKEDWEQSLKKFESSLKLNPQDADAKFNHEFVKRKLEELKKQQQQQQQNKSQPDQNQTKDQQQSNQQNQSGKDDRQQNSQSQPPRDQKSDSSQQQAQNQKPQQPDQNQQAKNDSSQQNKEQQPTGQQPQPKEDQSKDQETQSAYAAGQMTPEQAKQLLDAQKNDELLMPVSRSDKPAMRRGPIKDW